MSKCKEGMFLILLVGGCMYASEQESHFQRLGSENMQALKREYISQINDNREIDGYADFVGSVSDGESLQNLSTEKLHYLASFDNFFQWQGDRERKQGSLEEEDDGTLLPIPKSISEGRAGKMGGFMSEDLEKLSSEDIAELKDYYIDILENRLSNPGKWNLYKEFIQTVIGKTVPLEGAHLGQLEYLATHRDAYENFKKVHENFKKENELKRREYLDIIRAREGAFLHRQFVENVIGKGVMLRDVPVSKLKILANKEEYDAFIQNRLRQVEEKFKKEQALESSSSSTQADREMELALELSRAEFQERNRQKDDELLNESRLVVAEQNQQFEDVEAADVGRLVTKIEKARERRKKRIAEIEA